MGQLTLGLFAMMICLPSMQDWSHTLGGTRPWVQATFAGYVAAFGLLQLAYGAVSDRIGRRPVLVVGLLLAIAGSFGAAFATSVPVLVLARVVQGAGCAAGMVIGRALVQDLFQGAERTRAMALVGMSMGMSPPIALLLGGQIHVRFGWQANFVLIGVLATLALLAAWLGLPASTRAPAAGKLPGLRSGYARLGREPGFVLHVVLLAMLTATFYTFLGGAPVVFAGYGMTPERVGAYMMMGPSSYVVGNLLTTRLKRAGVGDRRLMTVGQAITMCGVATMLLLAFAGPPSPLALAAPMLFVGLGHGLLMPPTLSGTVGLVPALAGSASAVAGLSQQMTGALGGYLAGLVPLDGAAALTGLMFVLATIGLIAQAMLVRRRGA